jgi:hypothetical protein
MFQYSMEYALYMDSRISSGSAYIKCSVTSQYNYYLCGV